MNQIPDIQPLSPQAGTAANTQQTKVPAPVSGPANSGKALPKHGVGAAGKAGKNALDGAVVQVNKYLQSQNRGLEFSVDKATGQAVVKVVDQTTGKVIRQIPPEYIIQLAQTLLEHNGMSSTGIKIKT